MSEKEKTKFENQFTTALSASFGNLKASDALRDKIVARLREESSSTLPEGINEAVSSNFQKKLSGAVAKSQDWAPEDRVILQTEATLSSEMNKNVLSERSVGAILSGEEVPSSLANIPVPEEKMRFVEVLRSEVKRSTGELVAPVEVRERVVESVEKEAGTSTSNVIAFPGRSQWKRGFGALTSLAAGFAVVFFTLFGSADVALANSVRLDHQDCLRSAMKFQKNGPPKNMKAMMTSKYGDVPVPSVDSSWNLRVSQVCETEEGQPMVHLLYSRINDSQKMESLSLHFIPADASETSSVELDSGEVEQISDGDFPVVAWQAGDWVCTACSPDLDTETLLTQTSASI